jgi:two-component system, cell cycle response regulator DivK
MPKILLVEDNAAIRGMLIRRLQKSFDVVFACDGASACALAESERPNLILMDMHLPVMDGWSAARQLKTTEATRTIPIIALTADAMVGDREKALQAGCDDYETKPIDLPRLLDKMHALMQPRDP